MPRSGCLVGCGELIYNYNNHERPVPRKLLLTAQDCAVERQRLVDKFQRVKRKYKMLGKSEEEAGEKTKLKKVASLLLNNNNIPLVLTCVNI